MYLLIPKMQSDKHLFLGNDIQLMGYLMNTQVYVSKSKEITSTNHFSIIENMTHLNIKRYTRVT